jgi:hypothetical protein
MILWVERRWFMKRALFNTAMALVVLLIAPLGAFAQSGQSKTGKPPIAQPLVREGDLAAKLVDALKLGTTTSETEAESRLGDAGIAPRNGWIADYPVTPDIIGELRQSVSDAANARRLNMGKDEALKALQDAATAVDLAIKSGAPPEQSYQASPNYDSSGDNTVVNNYYADQGPPVVTYYAPPLDYYYLYTWVPYPFWWWNVWFPGYFILVDFHRVLHVHGRVEIISNHFVDRRANRVFRIDPVRRFKGRTYGGIGVPEHSKRFIITGARGGNEAVFRGSRERGLTGRDMSTPSPSAGRGREDRTFTPSSGSGRESGFPGGREGGGPHGGGARSERK